jgi:pyruvate formate lyase activating enzyme
LSQFLKDHEGPVPGDWITPDQIVATALRQRCRSLSFTYTEPTVFFEYALDTARWPMKRIWTPVLSRTGS